MLFEIELFSDACLAPQAFIGDAAQPLGRFSASVLLTVLPGVIPLSGVLAFANLLLGVSAARR